MRTSRPAAPAVRHFSAFALPLLLLGIAAADSGRQQTDSLLKPSTRTGYGCKFVPSICSRTDVCLDDNLFGTCRSLLDDRSGAYWYTADADLRGTLEDVLNDLIARGYAWKDAYTQCVVDAVLRSYRQQTVFRDSVCNIYGSEPSQRDPIPYSSSQSARDRGDQKTSDRARLTEMERPSGNEFAGQLSLKDLETLQLLLHQMDDSKNSRVGSHAGDTRSYGAEGNIGSRAFSADRPERIHFSRQYGGATQPPSVSDDRDTLLLKLLAGELEPDQVPTDSAQQLVDYISSLLGDMRARRPIAPAAAVAAPAAGSAAYRDAARRFSLPSKLSGPAPAVVAESMTGLGIDARITHALVSGDGRRNNEDRDESVAVDTPRQPAVTTESSRAADVGHVTNDAVTIGSQPSKAKTAVQNQTSNASQSAWMIISSSVSSEDAQRLATNLETMLKDNNVTSVAQVRVTQDRIVVTLESDAHHHDLDHLVSFIGNQKDDIERNLGVRIVKTGDSGRESTVGSEAQAGVDLVPLESATSRRQMFIVIFVLCGTAVGIGGALAFICVIRRCQQRRGWRLAPGKEYPLSSDEGDEETGCLTHDYEDLVRQHIHSKTSEHSDSPPGSLGECTASPTDEADGGGGGSGRRSARSSQSSWSEEPAVCSMDVSTGHMILSYMEDHLKNKDRLEEEWQSLCSYRADLSGVDVAVLPKNKKRNRYTSVLPYDHNRVVLDETKNVSGDDYINASFVTDHHPRTASYIATQGPLATSVADFWQMVWERGTVVVVMLTRLNDQGSAGGPLCHRYWPNGSSELYHIYEVHLVSEHVWCDDYLVRSFYLKNLETNETRTVTQFHFLAWPEGGVPTSTKSLLDFRRKMNKSYRGRSCPIAVVCSDGAGRSGAFILLDMVINRLCKGAKEIDIAATLEHIRDQRMAAVQTKEQFEFVLSAIAEEVQAMLLSA